MSIKTKEKPGFLEGLSKEFFNDVPYSPFLTRGEQSLRGTLRGNEIATRSATALTRVESGQRRQVVATMRGAQEAADTREITENTIAPTLQNIASSNVAIAGRLQNLQSALEDTMGDLGEKVDGAVGIPTEKRDIDELIGNGSLDEAESIILAAKGFLNAEQRKKLQDLLPAWKVEIIRNGLVTRPDPKREKKLATHEKIFLAELRRKSATPIEYFRSLEPVARHRMLDSEVHHALAKDLREVRFGTEGTNYGIRELNAQMDNRISQGDTQIEQGSALISQGSTRIEQGRRALANDQISIAQRETALRLARVGIFKQDQLIGLGQESLGIQSESLSVQTDTRDGISDLRDLAQRAGKDRAEIATHTEATVRNTEIANILAVRAETQRMAISEGIENLELTTVHYGELQSHQMEEAQETRLQQLQLSEAMLEIGEESNMLLADIGEGIVGLTHYAALQVARLEGINNGIDNLQELGTAQITQLEQVNSGIDLLAKVGIAHLESSGRIEGALKQLDETVSLEGKNIVNVIESVRVSLLEMEARAIDRDISRNQISAGERFREAMIMLKVGEVGDAIECFDESIAKWRADFLPYLQRGLCYVVKEDLQRAESDFTKSLKLVPRNQNRARAVIRLNLARLSYSEAKIHFNNGHSQRHEEKLLQAVEEAKEAVNEDSDFLESYFALATYLAAFKLFDEALAILIEIVPKDPKFAKKIEYFEVFEPLRELLGNTLAEDFDKDDPNENKFVAHLAIAKDSILIGDIETALKCIKYLIHNGAQFLNTAKFWEIDLFEPLEEEIVELLLEEIDNNVEKEVPEEWYAIASICLNFQEISVGNAYIAFRNGANTDSDFENKFSKEISVKLKEIMGKNTKRLFELIVKIYPPDFPWLKDWLKTYAL